MPRGGQRGYGNAGRTAYAGTTRGGQSRAVMVAAGVTPPPPTTPSLDFSAPANSQFVPVLAA